MNFYFLRKVIKKWAGLIASAILLICLLTNTTTVKAQVTPGDSISVHKAIALALKNQPRLNELKAQFKGLEAQVSEAKSNKYPQLGIEGHATHISPVSSFQLTNQPPENIEPQNSLDAHFAAHQLIYDFGRTKANIALAHSKTLTGKQRMKVRKWTISYFTVQTYYSVLYFENQIKVEKRQIKLLRDDLQLAQNRFNNGTATKYDVLSLKVRIAEENNKRLDLVGQKRKRIIELRKLFGWTPHRPVRLSGSLKLKRKRPAVNPDQLNYANRPDFDVLQQRKKVARQLLTLNSFGSRPSISADATAGYKNGFIKNINRLFSNYSVGVSVNVPIFNGFRTQSKKQEAQARIENIEAQTTALQRTINAQVRKAYVDVKTGLKKLSTADLQIKQAKEQLRLAKLRYRKGVITNTDLLTSETALAGARLQKVAEQYQILVNQFQLRKAAGKNIWAGGPKGSY